MMVVNAVPSRDHNQVPTGSTDLNQVPGVAEKQSSKGTELSSTLYAQGQLAMNSSLQLRQLRIGACWLSRHVLCLLLIVVQPITCFALDIRRVQTCSGTVLRLRGDIKEGDFSQLKWHFKREAIIGFDLSSDGGDFEEGLRIADLTRHKKLTVYVAGECSSACADVFFAAAKRFFGEDSKIGVHSVSNNRDIEDVGFKLLTMKLARFWAKQGIPNSAIGKMVTTRPETITYLDRTDLSGLQASAGNPFAYEAEVSSAAGQAHQQSCANWLPAASGGAARFANAKVLGDQFDAR